MHKGAHVADWQSSSGWARGPASAGHGEVKAKFRVSIFQRPPPFSYLFPCRIITIQLNNTSYFLSTHCVLNTVTCISSFFSQRLLPGGALIIHE